MISITTPILESPHMVVTLPPEKVKRSWRERLFSLPWRPLQTHYTVVRHVPDPNVYRIAGPSGPILVCHPVTAHELREYMSDIWRSNALGTHIDPHLPCPRVD